MVTYEESWRFAVFIFLLVGEIGFSPPLAIGAGSWQSVKLEGDRYAVEKKFRLAADTYERAILMLPPNSENDRVDMQIALATTYNNLLEIDKAVSVLKIAGDSIKKLKAQNNLDPQVLVSLKSLIEVSDRGFPSTVPYEKGTKAKMRIAESINAICADIYPQANTTKRKLEFARSFLANGDIPGAERQLLALEKSVARHDPMRGQVEWALGAVQQYMAKPQLINALAKREQKKRSEAWVLGEIASAQMWAANYEVGKQTLNKALSLLKRKPNRDDSEFVLTVYVDIFKDMGDEKGAEPWLRRRLALFSPDDGIKYYQYSRALAHCLRRQHRFEDADAVMPKKKKNRSGAKTEWEWFLTEKEKADLEQADAARLGKHSAEHSNPKHDPPGTTHGANAGHSLSDKK